MSDAEQAAERALADARDYAQWLQAARELDRLDGRDRWRAETDSADYDHHLIASRSTLLRRLVRAADHEQLVFRLREELHGNLGNMANPALYRQARAGTKHAIVEYLDAVCAALDLLCDSDVPSLPPSRKRRFFNRAARSFGRSALLLSGGASLGLFHLGVIEELAAQGLLPNVVSGSSAGAIVAGFLATHDDAAIRAALQPGALKFHWLAFLGLEEIVRGEAVLDQQKIAACIRRNVKDMTFLEAYEATGRILNISVSPTDPHQFPRLLNYLSSPNVLIRQAALASSAIPGLLPPVQLRARNFRGKRVAYAPESLWADGSVHDDIPKDKVNRLHNVNHYIVSQTNPHIVPFLDDDGEDHTGVLPFLRELITRGPVHQLEHVLGLVQRHFEVPGLEALIRSAHAIVGQNYSGDITIHPPASTANLCRVFSNADDHDARTLIEAGRRATWPHIERIRNTTRISRCFGTCLERLGRRYHYVKR